VGQPAGAAKHLSPAHGVPEDLEAIAQPNILSNALDFIDNFAEL
jgi:hypothetical protein